MLRNFVLIVWLITSTIAKAEIVSGDKPYFLIQDGGYQFILTDEHRYILPELIHFNHFFLKEYQRSFDWKFDEKASLILASMQNQITNGYATVIPNLMTVFYPTGGDFMDEGAFNSWIHMLLSHETSHLYQLSAKQGFAKDLHPIVGNPFYFLTPWMVPVFVAPNLFNPTFLLEGNAVYNESRFGFGGRLYSGEYRALVYALAKAKQIYPKRLINDHLWFPFGKEKYLVGGYFFNHVRNWLPSDQINHIFLAHGDHYINPLLLNSSFESTYGFGYEEWIESFAKDLELRAASQQSSPESSLIFGLGWAGFNNDKDSVFGLMQTDMKTPPSLVRIRKSDGQVIENKKMDLAVGKLFWLDNQWMSVSSEHVSPTRIEYGLFKEALKPYKDFRSQVVMDLRGGHTLTVDELNSLSSNQLLLDGKPFAKANSSAVLDDNGHVYYFKQKRKTRTLYKDETAVFSYQGYYGKPLEVDAKGHIYFIASADTGSSLFVFANGKIQRLSESDVITDARILNHEKASVVEVSDKGYDLKVIPLKAFEENPAEYVYAFEKESNAATYFDLDPAQLEQPKLKETAYSPLRELRRSSFEPSIGFYDDQTIGGIQASFVDPLQQNSVSLSYMRTLNFNDEVLTQYTNTARRLNWYFGGYYYEERDFVDEALKAKAYNNSGFLGLTYPFYQRGRWKVSGVLETSYVNNDYYYWKPDNYVDTIAAIGLKHSTSYPLSFEPYREYSLTTSYSASHDADKGLKTHHNAFGIKGSVTYDVYKENILSASIGSSFATSDDLTIQDPSALRVQPYNFVSLVPGFSKRAREIRAAGLTYKKVFQTPLYFTQIPLGLRRTAPYVGIQYFDLKQTSRWNFDHDFTQYEFGLDVEFLLAHRFPWRFNFSFVSDNRNLTPGGLYLRSSSQWSF